MTVLEIIEMLQAAGTRAGEHTSERLHVEVQITHSGILISAVLDKAGEHKGRPEVESMCTGEVSWEELPDCQTEVLRKFVDEVVSCATDDRKLKKGKAPERTGKGTVIRLSDWKRDD
jgi:hypothetical protein